MLDRRAVLQMGGAALLAGQGWGMARAASIIASRAGLIFTTVSLNGRDAKALIDSGSVRGIQLSQALATSLGLELSETGQKTQRYDGMRPVLGASLKSLAFAGTTLANVTASVSPGDIENIAQQVGEPFDAILGWPIMSKSAFVIDYRGGSMELREERAAGGLVLPLKAGVQVPVTTGTLSDAPVSFLVDTGAPWCNVDPSLAGGAALGERIDLPFQVGDRELKATFRVKDLSAMTRGTGARAVLGHRFLQAYRFIWSPAEKAVRLA
jgi:predicted aspartyl protease